MTREHRVNVQSPDGLSAARDEGPIVAFRLPRPRAVLRVLAGIAVLFFAFAALAVAVEGDPALLVRLDSAQEANVPTWYSTVLWLVAAALALAVGTAARRSGESGSRWLFLGGLFLLASIDEAGQLHEQTVGPLMTGAQELLGVGKSVARAVSVGTIGLVLGLIAAWLWPWFSSLSRALRLQLVLAASVFVSGALVLEVASRLLGDHGLLGYLSPVEESSEMLGVSLLIVTLLPAIESVRCRPLSGRRAVQPPATGTLS
jgi:hypothetical protein